MGQTPIVRHRYAHDRISAISGIAASPKRSHCTLYCQLYEDYFLGQRYRLRVIEGDGANRVAVSSRSIIELHARSHTSARQRGEVLHQWYRRQLKALIPPLLEKWQLVMGVQVADWGIKKMKTRWGSCNRTARRIWLNLELAKKPMHCLEYIAVHEMVRLLERHHSDRFRALMDQFMPQWRSRREELNRTPLGHENWEY
ncbi:MAG TPA: SprT family zinc-dependent metalloprotease [Candidatus Methylomirabilis sp.]|nr:SprT family zinc-dependent metalloprotease [Candidatus Methylomirabilis sp.]